MRGNPSLTMKLSLKISKQYLRCTSQQAEAIFRDILSVVYSSFRKNEKSVH